METMEVHWPQDLTDGDGGTEAFSLCVCVKEVAYIFLTDVESRQNVVVSGAVGTPTCLLDGSHSVPPQIQNAD